MDDVLPETPGPPHSFLRKLLPLYLFFNLSDIWCLCLGARKCLLCHKLLLLLIQNMVLMEEGYEVGHSR